MKHIATTSLLSIAMLAAAVQASSACMLQTPLPPYCHVKCTADTWGKGFWEFEKCYIGAPNPNAG
ncbi:MAG: hypothetical protein J0H18_00505 [Rhizobiales bacterium]|nr:hypothetical protein [Hyphomicrobiales bacterium]OJY07389.1 MAG: hypothetical protein BGP07_05705 [Rhizobiales bacterium 63-22]